MKKNVWKKFYSNKQGVFSIYSIIWSAFLLLLLLFGAEITHVMKEYRTLTYVTDNAGSGAVMQLIEEKLREGIVEIDEEEAKEVATKVVVEHLALEEDLTLSEGGHVLFREDIIVDIDIVNLWSEDGQVITHEKVGNLLIHRPSVIVYVEYPMKGLLIPMNYTIRKLSVSQAQFRPVDGF